MVATDAVISLKRAKMSYKNGVAKNKNMLIINNILSITIYISKIKTKILKIINILKFPTQINR